MATIPAAGYISDAARIKGELKTALESLVASVRHVPWSGQVELTNTIVSGAITPAGSGGVVVVDTESLAATDDLSNIVTTNYPEGAFLLVRNTSASRVVTVKHAAGGIGAILLDRSVDYVIDDTKKWLLLRRVADGWDELLRGPQRLTAEVFTKLAAFTVQKENLGNVFVCSGTYTISLATAASLGSGFTFGIRNVGTTTIVIDPNGSELIDGALTMSIPQGWGFQIVCTGTGFATVASTGPNPPAMNPVVNGMCDVWQRGTSFTYTLGGGSGSYLADRWMVAVSGTSITEDYRRSTNVPTFAQAGLVINYSMEVDCTNAVASPAVSDMAYLRLKVTQGYWLQYRKRQFTLSFWVMSPKTGSHCIVFKESSSYSYVGTYSVTAANTWEFKSITIPASIGNVLGTWPTYDLCDIIFPLYAGSNFAAPSNNVWVSGSYYAMSSQPNLMDNTANFFRVTGVKMELGSIATPYDVTSFEMEYLRCLHHYEKSFRYGTTPASGVGANTGEYITTQRVGASTVQDSITVFCMVPKFVGGFVNIFNPDGAGIDIVNRNTGTVCSTTQAQNLGEHCFSVKTTTPGGSAVSETLAFHWTFGL